MSSIFDVSSAVSRRNFMRLFGAGAAAAAGGALATVKLELADAVADRMDNAELEALRASIPAARALPLLRQLAAQKSGVINIEYLDGRSLAVEVQPCS